MEKVFDQSFTVANIVLLKNYSNLKDRKPSFNTFSYEIDEIEDIDFLNFNYQPGREKKKSERVKEVGSYLMPFVKREKKERKIKTFYNDQEINEKIEIFPATKKIRQFYTTKDRHIIDHYGNPFSKIEINNYKRLIYKDDKKIVIKIFNKRKFRNVNWRFFKEYISSNVISFNLVTGNFVIITKSAYNKNKKIKDNFRTNSFDQLKRIIGSSVFFSMSGHEDYDWPKELREQFKEIFNFNDFVGAINKHLLNNKLSNYEDIEKRFIYHSIIEDFVTKRGIKVPNDYIDLLTNFYPKVKQLKKNDNKLVQAVLDMYKIKSKSTIKLLHENNRIHIPRFVALCRLFGDDYYHYINKINPIAYTDNELKIGDKSYIYENLPQFHYELTKDEKDNVLKVINDAHKDEKYSRNFEIEVKDHLQMILNVRKYVPDVKFTCTTKSEFDLAHRNLSQILSKIRKGWTIEYQFEEKMLLDVENEMFALDDESPSGLIKLKPFILKREEDYTEEGHTMHHCVAGYANKDKSIIVSLRTPDNADRVTCEFDIQSGRVIQKRHFCNGNPPQRFIDGLLMLEEKIEKYARWGLLNWKEKKKVPVKINGIEIIPEQLQPRTFHDLMEQL